MSERLITGGIHHDVDGKIVISSTYRREAQRAGLEVIREREKEELEQKKKQRELTRLYSFLPTELRTAIPQLKEKSEGIYSDKEEAAFIWIDLESSGKRMQETDGPRTLIRKWNEIMASSRQAMLNHGAEVVFFAGDGVLMKVPVRAGGNLTATTQETLALAQKLQLTFNHDPSWRFRMAVGNTNDGEVKTVKTKNLASATFGPIIHKLMVAESQGTVGRVMATPEVQSLFVEHFEPIPAKKGEELVPALTTLPPLSTEVRIASRPASLDEAQLDEYRAFVEDHIPSEITDRPIEENRLVSVVFLEMELPEDLSSDQTVMIVSSLKRLSEAYGGFLKINATEDGEMKPMIYFGATGAPDPHAATEFAFQAIRQLKQVHPENKAKAGIATGQAFVGEIGTDEFRERTVIGDASLIAARLVDVHQLAWGAVVTDSATKELLEKDNAVKVESYDAKVKTWEGKAHEVLQFSPKTLNRAVAYGQEDKITQIKNVLLSKRGRISLDGPPGSSNRFLPLFAYAEVLGELAETPESQPSISHYVLPSWAAHIRYFAARHLFREGIELSFSLDDRLEEPLLHEQIMEELKTRTAPLIIYVDEAQRLDDDSRQLFDRLQSEPEINITIILNHNENKTDRSVDIRTEYLSSPEEFEGFIRGYLKSRDITIGEASEKKVTALARTCSDKKVPQETLLDIFQLASLKFDPTTHLDAWIAHVAAADTQHIAQVRFSMLNEINPARSRVLEKFIDVASILSLGENSPFSIDTAMQLCNHKVFGSDIFSRQDLEFLIGHTYLTVQRNGSNDTAVLSMGMARNRYHDLSPDDKIRQHEQYLEHDAVQPRRTLHTATARSAHAQAVLTLVKPKELTPVQVQRAMSAVTGAADAASEENEYRVAAEQYGHLIHFISDETYLHLITANHDSDAEVGEQTDDEVEVPTLAEIYFEQGFAYHRAGVSELALSAMTQSLVHQEEKIGQDDEITDLEDLLERGRVINALIIICEKDPGLRTQYIKRLEGIVATLQEVEPPDAEFTKQLIKFLSNIRGYGLQLRKSPLDLIDQNKRVTHLIEKLSGGKITVDDTGSIVIGPAAKEDGNREFLAIELDNIVNYYWHLGNTYRQQGNEIAALENYKQAERLCFRIALSLCEKEDHTALGWAFENLAVISVLKGDYSADETQRLFNTGLHYVALEKDIVDLQSMIEEGRQQKPPLLPTGAIRENPYVQEALRLLEEV